jgi:NDP-sugar pyrophosphorylase family protein
VINDPFLVINADDFYGRDAFQKAKELFMTSNASELGMVAFKLGNTLSNEGGVSRGVCKTSNNKLIDIKEHLNIQFKKGEMLCEHKPSPLDIDQLVSMNFWILNPSIFKYLSQSFDEFYMEKKKDDAAELFLPLVIDQLIQANQISVNVKETNSSWFGMTFPGDLNDCRERLHSLIDKGIYPEIISP